MAEVTASRSDLRILKFSFWWQCAARVYVTASRSDLRILKCVLCWNGSRRST